MNNDALIWIIIVSLTSVGSNIAIMIGTMRRKPPLEGQFADRIENAKDHDSLHKRITDAREHYVAVATYNREISERDRWRTDVDLTLKRVDRGVTALAVKAGVEVDV